MFKFIKYHIDYFIPAFVCSFVLVMLFTSFHIEHVRKIQQYYSYPNKIVLYEKISDLDSRDKSPENLIESIAARYSEFGYIETFEEVNPGIYKVTIHKFSKYDIKS